MARYTGPRFRLSRRLGIDLNHSRSDRPASAKCKMNVAPGQHGSKKARVTVYGLQLKAKQVLRRMYGVLEKQFRNYYYTASRKKGSTGEILLQLLEMRLDNIVYRSGFAVTRSEARQLVSHKAICVNGSVVNIPSFQLKPGDVVEVREKNRSQTRIKISIDLAKNNVLPEWLQIDFDKFKCEVKAIPIRSQLPSELNENNVVELYSK